MIRFFLLKGMAGLPVQTVFLFLLSLRTALGGSLTLKKGVGGFFKSIPEERKGGSDPRLT
jgi:hypothetical protein